MAGPYIGEIRIFGGNFAPSGWAFCEGQTMPISENDALFTLIGTTYGGDGQETFNLPDLRGRLPVHQGTGGAGTTYIIGESGGVEQVTLTTQQIPNHNHQFLGVTNTANSAAANGNLVGASASVYYLVQDPPDTALNAAAVVPAGGSQPHSNLQPYACVNFIISLFGVFPSQT